MLGAKIGDVSLPINDQLSHHVETSQIDISQIDINWLVSIWYQHWSYVC